MSRRFGFGCLGKALTKAAPEQGYSPCCIHRCFEANKIKIPEKTVNRYGWDVHRNRQLVFLGSTLSVVASLWMLWLSYFATKRTAIDWIRQKWPALL